LEKIREKRERKKQKKRRREGKRKRKRERERRKRDILLRRKTPLDSFFLQVHSLESVYCLKSIT
jgi:hypothetical protein